jgi:thioesterase domain-containing protein
VKIGIVEAVEAAFALGEQGRAEELLAFVDAVPPGLRSPYLEAQTHRFRARRDGDDAGFEAAAARFRELGIPFWLAVTLLEHGEALVSDGRSDEAQPLLAEARELFEQLGAKPWLERLAQASPAGEPGAVPASS